MREKGLRSFLFFFAKSRGILLLFGVGPTHPPPTTAAPGPPVQVEQDAYGTPQ